MICIPLWSAALAAVVAVFIGMMIADYLRKEK
jgi:hypothetical protein